MPTKIRTTRQRTEIRQSKLVEAALLLAAQRNPGDITTGDLADVVGISQGAVFKHFASKEAIWLAVLEWVKKTLMEKLVAAATKAELGADKSSYGLRALQAVFFEHIAFVAANPGVPRVIFQELQRAQDTPLKASVRGLMHPYRQLLMQLLIQAQAEASVRPDINVQAAVVLFIGSVQGLVIQSLIAGDVNGITKQAPAVFDLYLCALCAPSSSQLIGHP